VTHALFLALVLAALVNGVLAGINLDRYIVQEPAFRRLPVERWVEYVRLADLRTGLVWYPLLAVLSLLTILAADWLATGRQSMPQLAGALGLTTLLVVAGLVATGGAAPTLLRLRSAPSAESGRAVFARFHRWGLIRAVFQTLAFLTTLWALLVSFGITC
jgi:hypothetical protein